MALRARKEADEAPDPRDTAFHPRKVYTLDGHGGAERTILEAHGAGKLHHGWLITGPKGIGKATLAFRVARYILSHPDPADARGCQDLFVSSETPVSHRIVSGGHSDLLVLQRPWVAKDKRMKQEISADDARSVSEFLHKTAGEGGWRVCIIDAADDLGKESANAILKILEEPPSRTLFLLVSHAPGGLLPTIRSRCLRLPLHPLSDEYTGHIVGRVAPKADPDKRASAVRLSHGSPGRALALLESAGAEAFRRFLDLAAQPRFDIGRKLQIGASFAKRGTADDFAIFSELLTGWTGAQARATAAEGRGVALAMVHDEIGAAFELADAFNLDWRQAVLDALGRIETALKAA